MDPEILQTRATLDRLSPGQLPVLVRTPLVADECHWFNQAIDRGLFAFRECPPGCFRVVKWGVVGPDHFDTPSGKPRHLFSAPHAEQPALNREYVPHIAAYSRAVYDFGYDPGLARFSYYRRFTRHLLTKRAGGSYETDVEFDDKSGGLQLQIEAKTEPREVVRLAAQLDAAGSLAELPPGTVKEIEYVLDLAPRYFWLVGPGSIDPARYVYRVDVAGLNARFERTESFPEPH